MILLTYQKAMWQRAIRDTSAIYGGILNMIVAQLITVPLAVWVSEYFGETNQWWPQLLATIIALFPIAGMIVVQRVLAPIKIFSEQSRLLELRAYEDIHLSHYMHAWSKHHLDMMSIPPTPYDTRRLDLRVTNIGGTSVRNCSFRFISFDFMGHDSEGEWESNSPLIDQKLFNWEEGYEISNGKIDQITANGGFSILTIARTSGVPRNFYLSFIDGPSQQLLSREGHYNLTIQLDAQVEKDGNLVDLAKIEYLVGFEFSQHRFVGILVEMKPMKIAT